jgi:Xaa-Pro dipeptidase
MLKKRELFKATAGLGLLVGGSASAAAASAKKELTDLAAGAIPISPEEHEQRLLKAQELMQQQGIEMLVIEAGSALIYFTGIRWWRSERFTGVIVPKEGKPIVVTPFFEEPSVRETVAVDVDIRTWNEHESPFALVAGAAKEWGFREGRIAIEETVRHFIADGVAKALPAFDVVSGMSVTRGVRMFKSPAELALMQTANDITIAAYKHIHSRIELGMSQGDISEMMREATTALGGSNKFAMVLLNDASAYPHGTRTSQVVREGSTVLMDCGCSVHDYQSDISRTWVFGEPSGKQRKVWDTVKRGQELALETARPGVPAGRVDQVVREFYEREGFGPDYQLPGLSHRLGHGIGMDGHEPINFVRGEQTPLAPGMCFSNEPGIYLPGEFGIRLEDCLYMTDSGPQLFSTLSPSIDQPFATA